VQQPQLRELLEQQHSLIVAQGVALAALQAHVQAFEVNICQRLDAIVTRDAEDLPVSGKEFASQLEAEINRLDGYLLYQSDETRRAVAAGVESILARSNGLQTVGLGPRRVITAGPGLDAIFATEVFDIVVPTREEGLLAFLSRHGAEAIEPGVRAVLASYLRPGDVAIDAGASIGLHALGMAAAVGPAGRVVCFEPMPHVADALLRTLRMNGFAERAEVHTAALSDSTGTADLFAAVHSPLSSLFPLPTDVADDPLIVELQTLDAALPPGSRVDVVKMDVEGAEPRVWRGMQRVRAENHRLAIVLEWSASHFARAGENPADFMREILAEGFSVAAIDDEQPGSVTAVGIEESTNLEAGNLILLRGF
jgi:FkbM family methyltransferase